MSTFTHKHYEILAAFLGKLSNEIPEEHHDKIVRKFTALFRKDNPRFQAARFRRTIEQKS